MDLQKQVRGVARLSLRLTGSNANQNTPFWLGQPNLDLTPEERRVFGQLFQAADTGDAGVLVGDVAVKFFERTKLPPSVLGEVRMFDKAQDIYCGH